MPTPAKIKVARETVNLTQTEAAALLDIDRVTFWRYECGDRTMSEPLFRYFMHVTGQQRIPFSRKLAA